MWEGGSLYFMALQRLPACLPHLPGSYYPVRKRLDLEEGKIKKQKDGLICAVSLGSLWLTADYSNIQLLSVIDHDPGNILGVSLKLGLHLLVCNLIEGDSQLNNGGWGRGDFNDSFSHMNQKLKSAPEFGH